ncbi:MAG: hypothetical protein IJS09_02680 [Treponema sp.]|nr:hypothetical protein [Treponema sp.]
MKALLVADNNLVIDNVSTVLKTAGYDIITYHALLKALDNIEEISPHLIVISTKEYPRHWKTLAQYATVPMGSYTPQVILYTGGEFSQEDQDKAAALHVRGYFKSVNVDGLDELRTILSQKNDIFSGDLTDAPPELKPIEIPDDFAEAHAHDEKMLEEFVNEEVSHPGVSLEKIGLEIENEVKRASSPIEAAAVTDEELEESDDRLEDVAEIAPLDEQSVSDAFSVQDKEKEEKAVAISIDDILKQNQSFNRFAEIPEIKTEEEAKSGGEKTYDFGDVKGRREDAGDIGKSPMDLWDEIEAENGAGFSDELEPEPEPNFNPIAISMDELKALEHTKPVGPEQTLADSDATVAETASETIAEESVPEDTDSIESEESLSESVAFMDEEPGANFIPLSESLAKMGLAEETENTSDESLAESVAFMDEEPGANFIPLSESLAKLAQEDAAESSDEETVTTEEKIAEPEEKPIQISLEELLNARKAIEGEREKQKEMHNSVKQKVQKVAESAQYIEQDPEHPVTVTQREVDEVQQRNQVLTQNGIVDGDSLSTEEETTTANETDLEEDSLPTVDAILQQNLHMDTKLDWLAEENADEPEEHPDTDELDIITDPTGEEANEIATSMQDILSQNQIMDKQLEWLSNENADEPEAPEEAFIEDFEEPTGMSASERDANVQDILTQNTTQRSDVDEKFTTDMDNLQHMVEKLNIMRSIACSVLISNPETGALISGTARNYNNRTLEFTPDIPKFTKNFTNGTKIPLISIKTEHGIEAASATVISTGEQYLISINKDE